MVNLLDVWETVGGVHIHWWYPAKDFQVWYSPYLDPISGTGTWFPLANFTGNNQYLTTIMTPFIGQYLSIRMTKSAHYDLAIEKGRRGQVIYGIFAVNVIFEKNVALGKALQVSGVPAEPNVDANNFAPAKALDTGAGSLGTFWMPNPGLPDATLVFSLDSTLEIAGFMMQWRDTPDIFFVQKQASTGAPWTNVTGGVFDFVSGDSPVPKQEEDQNTYAFGVLSSTTLKSIDIVGILNLTRPRNRTTSAFFASTTFPTSLPHSFPKQQHSNSPRFTTASPARSFG